MVGRSSTWWVPVVLVAFAIVFVVAGFFRFIELFGGVAVMSFNICFDASSVPVLIHIVTVIVFVVFGVFQFSICIRRRCFVWHRRVGRVLVVAGLGVALSALWLNQFFLWEGVTREVLYPFRIVFGVALVLIIVIGFLAVCCRDFACHRIWMIRSYAIALVAGTQVFTLGFGKIFFGIGDLFIAFFMVFVWVINFAFAEWVICKRFRRRTSVAQVDMAIF